MAAWRKPLQAEELVCMRYADRERKKENRARDHSTITEFGELSSSL